MFRYHSKRNRVTFNTKKKVALYDGIVMLNIALLAFFATMLTSCAVNKNEEEENHAIKYPYVFLSIAMILQIYLELNGWMKNRQDLNYRVDDLNDEWATTVSTLERDSLQQYLINFIDPPVVHNDMPPSVTVVLTPSPSNNLNFSRASSKLNITYRLGQNQIYKLAHELKAILQLLHPVESHNPLSTPYAMSTLRKVWPIMDRLLDMPAKRRIANLSGLTNIPLMIALNRLIPGLMNEGSLTTFTTMAVLQLAIMTSGIVESYILSENNLKMKLEGFHPYYPLVFSPTPCIHGQLGLRNLFRPHGSEFEQTAFYILKCVQYLQQISAQSSYNQLDEDVRDRIDRCLASLTLKQTNHGHAFELILMDDPTNLVEAKNTLKFD